MKKFGSTAGTLDGLWSDISKRWPDITQVNSILMEEDETEIISDNYFQVLQDKANLHIRLKSLQTEPVGSSCSMDHHHEKKGTVNVIE